MKTSNKMLLTVIVALFLGVVVATVIVKLNTKPLFPKAHGKLVFYAKHGVIGDGKIISKTYIPSSFSTINIGGNSNVIIKSGPKPKVLIATDSNLIPHFQVYVNDNTLYIQEERKILARPSQPVKLVITTPELQKLNIGGMAQIHATNLHGQAIILNLSGSSKCYFSGKVNVAEINVRGASDIDAADLIANNVKVNSAGESHIVVNVNHQLEVNVRGSASVKYYGNPKQIKQNIVGSGSVRAAGPRISQ
ncbi:MAG: DUF2807 domain-containing protein [Gammaproteobacteria bacterium]|nr:DUF2807 domain-containing protein [Gammaproteobacteria bacterium]